MKRTTVEDLLNMDAPLITGTQAAHVLNMNPSRLLEYARRKDIPFPFVMSGNHRMKIPRVPFLRFLGYSYEDIKNRSAGCCNS